MCLGSGAGFVEQTGGCAKDGRSRSAIGSHHDAGARLDDRLHVQELVHVRGDPQHRFAGAECLLDGEASTVADDKVRSPRRLDARQICGDACARSRRRREGGSRGGNAGRHAEFVQRFHDDTEQAGVARTAHRDVRARFRLRLAPPRRRRDRRRPQDRPEVLVRHRSVRRRMEFGNVGIGHVIGVAVDASQIGSQRRQAVARSHPIQRSRMRCHDRTAPQREDRARHCERDDARPRQHGKRRSAPIPRAPVGVGDADVRNTPNACAH